MPREQVAGFEPVEVMVEPAAGAVAEIQRYLLLTKRSRQPRPDPQMPGQF